MAIELKTWRALAVEHEAACMAAQKAMSSLECHGRLDVVRRAHAWLETVELRMERFVARGGSVDGGAVNISSKGSSGVRSGWREQQSRWSLSSSESLRP